jgi:hypothetical protein
MRHFYLLIICCLLFLVQNTLAKNSEDFIKSKEDIIFHTPDMFMFSDIGKISEFKGVIDRLYFTSSDLKMVDLYQFKTEAVKVDKELCSEFIEKIFALSKSNLFELKSLIIENSNKGNICEAFIADKKKPTKESEAYYRYASIGFVNAKAKVLVYHPKKISDEKINEIRKFWNSLR